MALWGCYQAIQSTRPQTIAYGLVDSPVGQLAWIVETFKDWMDCAEAPEGGGGPGPDADQRDAVLAHGDGGFGGAALPRGPQPRRTESTVDDVGFRAPRRYAEILNNITVWSEFDRGGHFPAMEEPDLLSADIGGFFKRLA
ncbi:alpha/beta fold hydrolase [Streptomyces sp. NPDC002643]